jgi:fermentation-respiration switch protein FrsA (DUF1100 family)
MYHPLENNYSGDKLEVEVEKVKIVTSDNINLLGWLHKKDLNKFKTIVYFHGNAGTLENRIHKLNHFKDIDVNFLIIAWRGFSGNNGKPSEKGLYIDASSTILWLKKLGLKENDIILYGESLGTGVATEIAQSNNYAGLVLETPFTSMVEAAKNFYPYIPVSILLRDRYDNKNKIKNINIPVLVMHGEIDQIVPFWMGQKIHEMLINLSILILRKSDDHMMVYDEKLVFALKTFIESLN